MFVFVVKGIDGFCGSAMVTEPVREVTSNLLIDTLTISWRIFWYMKRIALNHDRYGLVDDEDYEYLNQWKWYCDSSGYAARGVYLGGGRDNAKRTLIRMHRQIMNTPKGKDTDHINGDRLDNRRSNLRICSHQQNLWNIKATGQYKGVSWSITRKAWRARIKVDGKSFFIGYFDNPIHAAMAWDIWAKDLHGEFASLNF